MTRIYYKEDASSKRIDGDRWQPGWGWDHNYNKRLVELYCGLVTHIEFPESNKIIYTYDTSNKNRGSQGNLLSITSDGNDGQITTNYVYNNRFNLVTEITDPMQNSTTITRDAQGNLDVVTLPQTPQTQQPPSYDYDYNSCGQLEKITGPLGSVTQYKYYPEASPSGTGIPSVTGRSPNQVTGGYLHQVIVDQGKDNISQTFTYDEVGNVNTMVDGENVTTTYGYIDANGNKNPFGEVLTLTQGTTAANDGQVFLTAKKEEDEGLLDIVVKKMSKL